MPKQILVCAAIKKQIGSNIYSVKLNGWWLIKNISVQKVKQKMTDL